MAWQMTGQWLEACSCKMICPCNMGPAEPTQGWCSAALVLDIERGNADGVDLSGAKAALAIELPGDFFGGIDKARLYIDEAASSDQRQALEAILTGKQGGVWGPVASMIKEWLPTQTTSIQLETGDRPSATIGQVGQVTMERVKTEAGQQAKLVNAPVAAAFGTDTIELARADGSRWSDPDQRSWESGGYGGVIPFSLSG